MSHDLINGFDKLRFVKTTKVLSWPFHGAVLLGHFFGDMIAAGIFKKATCLEDVGCKQLAKKVSKRMFVGWQWVWLHLKLSWTNLSSHSVPFCRTVNFDFWLESHKTHKLIALKLLRVRAAWMGSKFQTPPFPGLKKRFTFGPTSGEPLCWTETAKRSYLNKSLSKRRLWRRSQLITLGGGGCGVCWGVQFKGSQVRKD